MKNHYTKAVFLKSAAKVAQLPTDTGYEVAFAGRSNAGKSSALNTLTGIKQLARTSKTPGRTQLINVFAIDPERRLIDLPGYGYAKVSQKTKINWQFHLANYLETRTCLKGLILLVDIRHPLKQLDKAMINWANKATLPIHILLTKADKLSRGQAQSTLLKFRRENTLDNVSFQLFSSLKNQGIEDLLVVLNKWYEFGE